MPVLVVKPFVLRAHLTSDSVSADFIVTSDTMVEICLIGHIGCDHGIVHFCVRLHINGRRIDSSQSITMLCDL